MSDEFLVINTTDGLVKPKQLTPLTLYDENFSLLNQKMQDYVGELPNAELTNFIERLKMTMKKFGGIGLSANQCGVNARIFIIGHEDFSLVCINPKVLTQSDEMIKSDEGCLSFPGLFCKIERPKWVDVEFTNERGELIQTRLEGLTARCYLHELDHMDGIKFTSYVKPLALKMAREKQQKRIKSAIRKSK
jgi:peptide deformylase